MQTTSAPTTRKWYKRKAVWIAVGVIVVIAIATGSKSKPDATAITLPTAPAVKATPTTEAPTTTHAPTTTEAPTTTVADKEWTIGDFVIELVTLESQCFNSAGGLVTVEPNLSISDLSAWDQEATLVYTILGGEAEETFNVTIHDDGKYSFEQHTIQTPTCESVLTAVPTRLIER